jgi:hypothetical protein
MLYREIIPVCFEIHTNHINTLCGQKVELLDVKTVVQLNNWIWKVVYVNTTAQCSTLYYCGCCIVIWCFGNVGNQTKTHHVTPQIKTRISTSQFCCLTQLLHYNTSDVIWPDITTECDVRTAITGIKWPADRRLCFYSNFSLFCYLPSHINIPYQLTAVER